MKRAGKNKIKFLAGTLALLMLAGLCLCGCTRSKKQEEKPVARLGEDVIELKEAVFYTRMLQEQWEEAYYEYAGSGMWQKDFDDEGRTFADVLKQDVMDTLTRIHLLCVHSQEYDVTLTTEEKARVAKRAEAFMDSNTPSVLEAAGATKEVVEELLLENELAARVSEVIQEGYTPQLREEETVVGKLTYCLFSVMGTYDKEGNHNPATQEELDKIRKEAEEFSARARELGDIAAAGDEISHTVIDVFYNDNTDGGAHPLVAETARKLGLLEVSEALETEDGYYIVQRVSDYDEEASAQYKESLIMQKKDAYLNELLGVWEEETPLVIDEELWDTVKIEEMLTER